MQNLTMHNKELGMFLVQKNSAGNVISQPVFNVVFHLVFLLSRPGLLNASDPGYPWLADSWPATSLPVNSSSGGPNDLSNFGRGGEYPGAVPGALRKRL